MTTRRRFFKKRGFTLIEVLVALLVTAAGLLGLAKMQALAIGSTKESGTRSLIALQTGSLTAAMHANTSFWADGLAPAQFTTDGATVNDTSHQLDRNVAGGCVTAACSPAQLAAVDVQNWATDMHNQFPGYTAKIDCSTTLPVSCSIYVTWSEKMIALNKSTALADPADQITRQSFSVYVKP